MYCIKSRVPWNEQQLSNVMSLLISNICVIYFVHTVHTFRDRWLKNTCGSKLKRHTSVFPTMQRCQGLHFICFWCGGNLEHAIENDWHCCGREYFQQYVHHTTKLPTQVSIVWIFVRILPTTANKRQVLAVEGMLIIRKKYSKYRHQ